MERDEQRRQRLATLVAEFRKTGYPTAEGTGYPTAWDSEHKQKRVEFEQILRSLPELDYANRQHVQQIWARAKIEYGSPGYIVQLRTYVKDATEEQWKKLRDQLHELCFGEGEFAFRINCAKLDIYGVGWATATRLPAICHPDRFIPNYVLRRDGKYPGKLNQIEHLMKLCLLDTNGQIEAQALHGKPKAARKMGCTVMRANDLLLETLRPHLTLDNKVDTWGMARFLYWLMRK